MQKIKFVLMLVSILAASIASAENISCKYVRNNEAMLFNIVETKTKYTGTLTNLVSNRVYEFGKGNLVDMSQRSLSPKFINKVSAYADISPDSWDLMHLYFFENYNGGVEILRLFKNNLEVIMMITFGEDSFTCNK